MLWTRSTSAWVDVEFQDTGEVLERHRHTKENTEHGSRETKRVLCLEECTMCEPFHCPLWCSCPSCPSPPPPCAPGVGLVNCRGGSSLPALSCSSLLSRMGFIKKFTGLIITNKVELFKHNTNGHLYMNLTIRDWYTQPIRDSNEEPTKSDMALWMWVSWCGPASVVLIVWQSDSERKEF